MTSLADSKLRESVGIARRLSHVGNSFPITAERSRVALGIQLDPVGAGLRGEADLLRIGINK